MTYFLIGVLVILIIVLVTGLLYLKFGLCRKFFHDILEWHRPDETESFDGCSFHSKCKYCGKDIMQDSQGNWF